MNRAPFILRDEAIRQRAIAFLSGLDLSKLWQITVAPYRANRSLQANNLYWKWVGVVALETGNTSDDIHEFAKRRFLPPSFVTVEGHTEEIRRSTTKLNTKEMSDYMTQFEAWAASELGIVLPRPEDRGYAA